MDDAVLAHVEAVLLGHEERQLRRGHAREQQRRREAVHECSGRAVELGDGQEEELARGVSLELGWVDWKGSPSRLCCV